MELQKAIKDIRQEFGKDVIAEKRFVNMIADFYSFRDNPADKRIISVIVNDGYTTRLLKYEEDFDISVLTNQIINEVCRNYGYREELVKNIISYIVTGVGFNYHHKNNQSKQSVETITHIEHNTDEGITPDTYFYLKKLTNRSQIICDAVGHYNTVDGSFVIHKGSILCMRLLKLEKYIGANGEKYVNRKFILNKKCSLQREGLYLVETNITCSSPSDAAFIVTCKETDGLIAWIDKKGKTLNQILMNRNR